MDRSARETEGHLGPGLGWLMAGRFILAAIIAAAVVIRARGQLPETGVLVTLMAAGGLSLVCLALLETHLVRVSAAFAFFQVALDICLISVLVYFTAGVGSSLVFLYTLSILAAGLLLSGWQSLIFASQATILLSGVTIAQFLMRPSLGLGLGLGVDVRTLVAFLLLQTSAFYVVAVLSSVLSARLAAAKILTGEILENMTEGLLVLDSSGRVVFTNGSLRSLFPVGLLTRGKTCEEIFPGEELAGVREALRSGGSAELPQTRTSPPVRIRTSRILTQSGTDRGLVAVFQDISLERRAHDAQLSAERARSVGELAAAIAHELRNPIASIRGASQELKESVPRGTQDRELFDIIMKESDRLERIISEFLNFARIRPSHRADCDVARVVRDVADALRRQTGEKKIDVVVKLPERLPAYADAEQLRQVFLNLGANAVQAINYRGRVAFTGAARTHGQFIAETGGAGVPGVEVAVADDGTGISEEDVPRIFDPFFTTKQGGTGMGLAIVNRIVLSHKGEISVETKSGKGSTFRVWLPAGPPGPGELIEKRADTDRTR